MPPPPQEPPPRQHSDILPHTHLARSTGPPQRLRNDESWVEISSQPSSSSLSSIGDEIVTTGLRVQHDPNSRRRRRLPVGAPSQLALEPRHTHTSSQEEYEESDSDEDEDRVLTSSNERISPTLRLSAIPAYDAEADSSDDENTTALGRRTDPGVQEVFTPQPNAFSHPPSSQRPPIPGSYFPDTSTRPLHPNARQSYSNRTASRNQHASHNHADHDAALRASLTTLLSIGAAAARGLPKRDQNPAGGGQTVHSNEPMNLRMVPESELVAANTSRPLSPSTRARSSPSISSQEAALVEKGKRKANVVTTGLKGEKARMEKKRRKGLQLSEEALLGPTLLTWVMSAGVVVLVSVVGFGAGYVIGREVGRQEAMAGWNGTTIVDGGSCGREAVRGSATGSLKRFKWGLGSGAKSMVA